MAAFHGRITLDSTALVAATARTVIQIRAPTNQRVRITSWGLYFDGTASTGQPVAVRILRQTTAGTMTTGTVRKLDDSIADTLQTGAGTNATAEPTASDVLQQLTIHPQTGHTMAYAFGQEPIVGAGDRLGWECTAPAGVNVRGFVAFEE